MCCNSRGLSRLGVLWGLIALVTVLIVFVSGSWLYTREPISFTKPERTTIITFRIGLWRVCPTIKKINASGFSTPSPACSLVKYSGWEEVRSTDLVTSSVPLDFTPVFITRMRSCTVLYGAAIVLLLLGFFFALLGHCNGDNKTLIACGMFILGVLLCEITFTFGGFYNDDGGPPNWPASYKDCGGRKQSPISLPSVKAATVKSDFPDFIRTVANTKAPNFIVLIKNDHTVAAKPFYDTGGYPTISGGPLDGTFVLDHVHFHWSDDNNAGTEHMIDGKKYALEAHAVHFNSKYGDLVHSLQKSDGLLVMGYLFKSDQKAANAGMDILTGFFGEIQKVGDQTVNVTKPFIIGKLIPLFQDGYLTYDGSLTTPPCYETVRWIVYETPLSISPGSLGRFRALYKVEPALKNNIRPIQQTRLHKIVAKNSGTSLLLGTGLVVFASTLSETLLDATAYHKEPPTGPVYEYHYGWCFFTAGAAFIMTKMAAVFSLSGYLNRFSSVDEMVRIMVPGAERKLREHHRLTTECMDRHLCSSTHQQRQQYDAISTSDRTPKYEPECGPLLNKTPPDVCTTNKCLEFTNADINCGVMEANFVEANSLAGQTVPITVKNHHGAVAPGISYTNFPPNKYGTMPNAGTTLHQGFLGVSELGSSSSNSSSTYCARSKTLQHQNRPKKKCVKIETFQTPEQFSDYGKRANTFGYSGSAV